LSSGLTPAAPDHAIASLNAIESGMSLVRPTDRGMSLAADPYGRVLAQTDFFGSTDRTMVAQVPVRHVATVYTAFGRWFGLGMPGRVPGRCRLGVDRTPEGEMTPGQKTRRKT